MPLRQLMKRKVLKIYTLVKNIALQVEICPRKKSEDLFWQTLSLSEGAVGFSSLLSKEPASNEQVLTISDVESILFSNEYLSSSNKDAYQDEKLKVSTECIKDIAQLTEEQSENPLWFLAR